MFKDLLSLPVPARAQHCPPFLRELIEYALKTVRPVRIWIYGSRARGDERPLSDYDLAFELPEELDSSLWTRFSIDTQDMARTLLHLDLLNLAQAEPELRNAILTEGILLYEKAP